MKYKNCIVCGKEYKLNNKYSLKQKEESKYCSIKCNSKSKENKVSKICKKCGITYYVQKYREKTSTICSNKCIKNGENFDKNTGYIRKNKTGIHRNMLEQFLKRKLLKNEIVHHINGDKIDNRIENLIVMTRAEHVSLHKPRLKR